MAKRMSRQEVFRLAIKYANTSTLCSGSYFWDEESLTKSQMVTVRKRAIVESIVDDAFAEKIGEKASTNAELHAGEAGRIHSEKSYDKLMILRANYVFPASEARKLVEELAESDMAVTQFGESKLIFGKLMRRTVNQAVVGRLVSDEVVQKLQQKDKGFFDSFAVDSYYNRLIELRNQGLFDVRNQQIPDIDAAPKASTSPASALTPAPVDNSPEDFQGTQIKLF